MTQKKPIKLQGWRDKYILPPPDFTPLILPDNSKIALEYDIFVPTTFDEYIGQDDAKDIAQIMIQAADKENRSIPNMLITGSYGLGKTTLAHLIMEGRKYQETTGTAANSRDEFKGYMLIDEIHNLRAEVCDGLNPLIDGGKLRIIGCTPNPGILPGPFRSRFRIIQLNPYTVDDLTQIQLNALNRKGTVTAPYILLEEISKRGRNTPRKTLQYLAFVLDLMAVKDESVLTKETLDEAFDKLGVDNLGLLAIDHRYMEALPSDRPVGLQYLQAVLQVDKATIEEEIEPYLLQLGLVDRTQKGRIKIASLEEQLEDYLDEIFKESKPSGD